MQDGFYTSQETINQTIILLQESVKAMKLKIQHLLPGLVSGDQKFKVTLSFTECEAELEIPIPKNI